MTTTPAVPAVISATNSSELGKVSQYIKAHEKLIIIALLALAGIYAYQRAAGIIETHYTRKVDSDHLALLEQNDKDKAIAQANAQSSIQYQQLSTQLAQLNAALVTAISARDRATVTQQVTDRTLPPLALAQRWTSLINMPAGVAPSTSGFTVTPGAATETVMQLEEVPQLKSDLQDTNALLTNERTQFNSLAGLNVGLTKQIDGLNIDAGLTVKACTDEKNLLIAKARKSKLRYFTAGFIAGVATRLLLKF